MRIKIDRIWPTPDDRIPITTRFWVCGQVACVQVQTNEQLRRQLEGRFPLYRLARMAGVIVAEDEMNRALQSSNRGVMSAILLENKGEES